MNERRPWEANGRLQRLEMGGRGLDVASPGRRWKSIRNQGLCLVNANDIQKTKTRVVKFEGVTLFHGLQIAGCLQIYEGLDSVAETGVQASQSVGSSSTQGVIKIRYKFWSSTALSIRYCTY